MYFEIKGKELELVQALAVKQDITLEESLESLINLAEVLAQENSEKPKQEFISLDQVKTVLDTIDDRLKDIHKHTLCTYINTRG